jgi:hypothetical protein
MTIDEILEQLRAIVEGAHGRDLTDDEVERYEQLETDLAAKRRDQEVRARQAAYDTPVRNDLHVHVAGTPDPNEDLNRAFENYLRTGKPNADLAELRVSGQATCAHHVLGRAVTGDDPSYLVAACAACNLHVGEPKTSPAPRRVSSW